MRRLHAKAAYVAVGAAGALALAGISAVQAQPTANGSSGSTVSTAKTQLSRHAARFGYAAGQSLKVTGVYSDATGSAIRFDRTYKGLPVIGGDFIVHLTPSGAFKYGNGRKVVGLPASIKPGISRAAATQSAISHAGYAVRSSQTQLVVFTKPNSSTLAWQVYLHGKAADSADKVYVSATSGRTLATYPTVYNDDAIAKKAKKDKGKGITQYSGKVKLPDVKKGKTYTLTDKTRGTQSIYNANHSFTEGVGTIFTDKNNKWGDGTESFPETAAADAAYGLSLTWDFYLKTYGRKGIADDGKAARGFVHYGSSYVNAFWSDGCFCMEFGDGSSGSGISNLTSIDVGGHEMSHGVTSRTARLIYSGESGGLNESTSDVMGTMVEWFANNKHDVPDYVIGEEIFRQYNPAVNYIRRMDDPHMDGLSADCWYSGVGNLNVHYSSGVGNHLFYLLSEGSGKKTINGIAYDSPTCDSSTIKGIGHDEAAAIWYRALTQEWVSTTNYHDARVGMLNAAADLYGKKSNEYKTTNKAWAAVSVTP